MQFSHLHCHTQYSILDGAANITQMVAKAAADGMPAVAITDHGNMFGVFEFVNACNKANIKPVVGCEFYMVEDMYVTSFAGLNRKDKRYHQLLLAKNDIGYRNLTRLTSLAYKEGLYSKWPRIDLNLLKKYKEGLVATTCCIGGIVIQTILDKGEEEGEKVFLEWLELFGEDYYIELQRHNIQSINGTTYSQEDINQILLKWSLRHNVPAIATNDSHYVDQDDSEMHDILLCINTAAKKAQPIKSDDEDGTNQNTRFGFPNDQFFFKSTLEMENLFKDIPQCLDNTNLIVDKIDLLNLKKDIMMPNFVQPKEYQTQSDYMRHLVYEGARKRYKELTQDIVDRLELELATIFGSSYEGYFLVIEDFLTEARRMNVSVGPGRGSAAGSVVAYCLGITQVDPIAYGLLFERFLNPERVSFPDIDIDFEDAGRQSVLDYVVKKYGENNVAQIVTYGTMKEKSAIKDVARVLDLPILEANMLTKNVPEGFDLNDILEDKKFADIRKNMKEADRGKADNFRTFYAENDLYKTIIDTAIKLKGSVRNVGVHACGVIIAPEDLKDHVPLSVGKDKMLVTQFDKDIVEKIGLLKMDFLGLKNLSIIKDILHIIKQRHGVDVDVENLSLDDTLTYELVFQKGMTDGVFQFESDGMKSHLKALKPDSFYDLIAMNALYRPGPMEYIPNYVARKHGREPITYDIADSKEYLEETYGITVYQEQVMLLSQKLAGFSKGQADSLRKAMGKKQIEEMNKLYDLFLAGCEKNGHDLEVCKKVWKDWEAFASYAFNKSHATCYALIAYQCAYLKAHYPSEFMAGLMSNNMGNTDDIKKYIEVSKKMGIDVLGPDVNESDYNFTVNTKGQIRFGLSAIKGVGENVIKEMVSIRDKSLFEDVFDLVTRLGTKFANKRVIEALAISGALDCFEEISRDQYFSQNDETSFIEIIIRYANDINKTSNDSATNLFGESFNDLIEKPKPPISIPFTEMERLEKEKEVLGIYMSGHPLDKYRKIIDDICTSPIEEAKFHKKKTYVLGLVRDLNSTVDMYQKSIMSFNLLGIDDQIPFKLNKKNNEKFGSRMENDKPVILQVIWDKFESKEKKEIYFWRIDDVIVESNFLNIVKKLALSLNIAELDVEFIARLEYICKKHIGDVQVMLSLNTPVVDEVKDLDSIDIEPIVPSENSEDDEVEVYEKFNSVEMKSLSYRVKISEELIAELTDLLGNKGFRLMV